MKETVKNILLDYLLKNIIAIVVLFVLYKVLMKLIDKNINKVKTKRSLNSKTKTYIDMFISFIKYAFLVIALLILLKLNGVNISSLTTGLGIIGVVGGLAIQDFLKDIIMGSNIITDDFYKIGDVVKYGDIVGKVIHFGLKSTKIEDIYTKNILIITNRNIDKIIKVSELLDIDIPINYEEKTEEIEVILNNITKEISKLDSVKKCSYLGLNELADSAILYKIRILCEPENKPDVNRQAIRIIKINLDRNNIVIPYNQLDVHQIESGE